MESRCCFPRLLASGYQCNLQRTLQHLKSSSQYWCPKPITDGGHVGVPNQSSFVLITLSFGLINLRSYWPRKWKHSIEVQVGLHKIFYVSQSASGVPFTRPTQEISTQFSTSAIILYCQEIHRSTFKKRQKKYVIKNDIFIAWRYHVYALKLTWYFTGCAPCTAGLSSSCDFLFYPKWGVGGCAPPLDPPLLKN